MTVWPQREVYRSDRGRILCMDSVGYVDGRNDVTDVLICASHGASCATQLGVWVRPRGLICHDAGIGKGEGGVSGLTLLEAYLIPGAMVAGQSARISDGVDMYENGTISRVNASAARLGARAGMSTREVAHIMLDRNPVPVDPPRRQIRVSRSEVGDVYALDTVKYVDARIAGSVLCMGSHAAKSMPAYIADFGVPFAGIITNDVGMAKDESGIAGLKELDKVGVPAATVSCDSARVGDAQSTYFDGLVSALNQTAERIGVRKGQPARQAADLMLRFARKT